MKNKYIDLIEQTFEFPQDEFSVTDNELNFHEVPLMDVIKQNAAEDNLSAEDYFADSTRQTPVQCGDGQG